ncbi:MAG: hypothetical protein JWP35_2526 [Caulobacter sp.]|nr:hypothetical protein [Caulobacter sp.]
MTTIPLRARLMGCAAFAASLALANAAMAQDTAPMGSMPMDHTGHDAPPTAQVPATHPPMDEMDMGGGMKSPFGPYAMTRDASGTSWQPDDSSHEGVMTMSGDWMIMTHALVNVVVDHQSGPRGGDKTFLAGMVMSMAQRPLGGGTLGLRAMLSPDPFMGKDGYPLLLAAGETADGATTLVDRQHPHDLFMELSASYSHPIGDRASAFVYAGLPGEPAFGPPAFMHRLAAMDSPEAPISHHWLDSTHITFGIVTLGVTYDSMRLEASAFRGREPDEHRFDIETGPLDSYSARVSLNPTPNWSFQLSAARINSPEELEPDVDQRRVSASALYFRHFGDTGKFAATFAWGRKTLVPGGTTDAWLTEAAVFPDDRWTVFGRAEQVDANELMGPGGGVFTVRKLSLGAIRDWRLSPSVKIGVGGVVSGYDIPDPLKGAYGSPVGAMAFVRLKIG